MTPIVAQAAATDATLVSTALFYVFAGVTAVSAIALVVSRNIVRTAVALLFALTGAAGLYFLLDAEFLAAVQLVVYAGGTLILIIFGVMLTSKSPFAHYEPKPIEVAVALVLGAILFGALVLGIANTNFADQAIPAGEYPVGLLGQALLGDYLVPFEIISVLLLVVMIGAAYLAKGRRREGEHGENPELSKQAREWT